MPKYKSGLWLSEKSFKKMDGRTVVSKQMDKARGTLIEALGGDPSPQESILIDKAVFLLYKTSVFESQMLNGNGSDMGQDVESYYLAWVNSLRRILEALGLKRAPKKVKDIYSYCNEEFGKK